MFRKLKMALTWRNDRRQEETPQVLGVADGIGLSTDSHISSPNQLSPCCDSSQNVFLGRGIGTSPQAMFGDMSELTSYGENFPGVLTPWMLRSLYIRSSNQRAHIAPHVEPQFYGFQLLGDSLLLRFAEQILNKECIYANGLRYLGLCVSGQTIDQLCRRVQTDFVPLGKRVILLIGTNDLLQGRHMEDMKLSFDKLVDVLEETVEKLVILTLPPIPKLEDNILFKQKFKHFNQFLKLFPRKYPNIFNIDITNLFETDEKNCDMEYFERWYDSSESRPDLIHLNRAGFILLREVLVRNHFLKN